MAIDFTKTIAIADDDELHVAFITQTEGLDYDITRYLPDGSGSFREGEVIARASDGGGNAERVILGKDIRSARLKACASHHGVGTSQYEILVKLSIRRGPGAITHLGTYSIPAGLASGDYQCFTCEFG